MIDTELMVLHLRRGKLYREWNRFKKQCDFLPRARPLRTTLCGHRYSSCADIYWEAWSESERPQNALALSPSATWTSATPHPASSLRVWLRRVITELYLPRNYEADEDLWRCGSILYKQFKCIPMTELAIYKRVINLLTFHTWFDMDLETK